MTLEPHHQNLVLEKARNSQHVFDLGPGVAQAMFIQLSNFAELQAKHNLDLTFRHRGYTSPLPKQCYDVEVSWCEQGPKLKFRVRCSEDEHTALMALLSDPNGSYCIRSDNFSVFSKEFGYLAVVSGGAFKAYSKGIEPTK